MSRAELKLEIEKFMEDAPETALLEALHILMENSSQSHKDMSRADHIKLILKEDQNLLNRLAQ
ncbi:hypothetical protein HQ865_12525 [Mucilaginibacter mali]|uniref:Uncharacterized protein n=1 Tax=Mucilaginibacter mali TaxID=2740462 RepID=A0A7D4Q3U8_9SPHI|nr:hypothetical protein [Mucilaginibacter mali]QKJ30547.1 hypothetical protein HQ865_12525 [Mucilaginibacter mali]